MTVGLYFVSLPVSSCGLYGDRGYDKTDRNDADMRIPLAQ